ncbi:MAG TPA: carbohydrate ABC transporter permease [Acidimicrobiia bacterium]|jgi:raffinose/stachyose/melibiose transport system permease protein|nr:carbohydrate ABC transporter permease [Acidimicrobiia bacterium]
MAVATVPARRILSRTVVYAVALAVLALILVPLVYAVLGGFRTTGQIAEHPVGLPEPWIFTNYLGTLQSPAFWRQVWNSAFIALATTFLILPFASLAAFALARYRFRGREAIYTFFTIGLLFPLVAATLPLWLTLRDLGLLGSPWGIILPQVAFGLPLSIVILRPFFRSIPADLEDAAIIDGCGPFRFYWNVMLPLSRPALSTIAVLTIVGSWNAFLLPLLVLTRQDQWTLPLGVNNISTQYGTDTALVLAYTVLSIVPALILYAFAERHIVSGVTTGAVKG